MANFNKVLLMGNLTREPQLTYLPSQTAVVDFGLATNRKWKSQDGSQREETCFIDCRAFGRTAENINKYLSKGRPVFLEGRLTFDSWTAQDGTKRSRHRVTVENFQFLPGGGTAVNDAGRQDAMQAPDSAQTPAAEASDDIPF
ncbi:MAG: single-stranded DNA-binding protein [Planctomycetota bacterium]|jgi:single-strand DNA-binding protein